MTLLNLKNINHVVSKVPILHVGVFLNVTAKTELPMNLHS